MGPLLLDPCLQGSCRGPWGLRGWTPQAGLRTRYVRALPPMPLGSDGQSNKSSPWGDGGQKLISFTLDLRTGRGLHIRPNSLPSTVRSSAPHPPNNSTPLHHIITALLWDGSAGLGVHRATHSSLCFIISSSYLSVCLHSFAINKSWHLCPHLTQYPAFVICQIKFTLVKVVDVGIKQGPSCLPLPLSYSPAKC